MVTKFHINKHGVPAPCRAQKGNCPYGGSESHFNTIEEAQEHADKINKEEFGILSIINGSNSNEFVPTKEEIKKRESIIDKIKEVPHLANLKFAKMRYKKNRKIAYKNKLFYDYMGSIGGLPLGIEESDEEFEKRYPKVEDKYIELERQYWKSRYERLKGKKLKGKQYEKNKRIQEMKRLREEKYKLQKALREQEIDEDMNGVRDPEKWADIWNDFNEEWKGI